MKQLMIQKFKYSKNGVVLTGLITGTSLSILKRMNTLTNLLKLHSKSGQLKARVMLCFHHIVSLMELISMKSSIQMEISIVAILRSNLPVRD
ncbi:hypothetical protein DVR14_24520 (plasmid) [Natrinema thermotolerans]|nr:hypothetical protein DVR14_24520 [Natrinema thermotolerans]